VSTDQKMEWEWFVGVGSVIKERISIALVVGTDLADRRKSFKRPNATQDCARRGITRRK
jgi:hypothetical protein